MQKLFALALLCVCAASGQSDVWKYSNTATLAGGSTAYTIALAPTGSHEARILDYTLQCSADATVNTERDGTAPTGTLGTWRPEDRNSAPRNNNVVTQPDVRVYFNSDSTGGSLADEPFVFPAGVLVPWNVGQVVLVGNGLTTNYTVRIATAVGTTCRFQIRVRIRR